MRTCASTRTNPVISGRLWCVTCANTFRATSKHTTRTQHAHTPWPIPWPTDPMPAGPRTVGRPYTRHLGRDTYLGTRDTCLCIPDTCLCTHARTQIHTLRVCICVFPKPPVRARTHDGSRDYFITDKTVPFFITDARAGTRTLPRSWTHARVHATQAYARTHADKHTRAHARTLT